MSRRYTNEQIQQGLRALAGKLGRTPRQLDLGRSVAPSYAVIRKQFGSLAIALVSAGLKPSDYRGFKLSPAQREEIGRRHVVGCHCHADLGNTKELADRYGVTIARICQIGREARRERREAA